MVVGAYERGLSDEERLIEGVFIYMVYWLDFCGDYANIFLWRTRDPGRLWLDFVYWLSLIFEELNEFT